MFLFEYIIFAIFFLATCFAGLVIVCKNPVHTILAFILVILNLSLVLFFLGFDFLGLVLIIVYIGSISVLFLFIVMMLNIKTLEIKSTYWRYLPVGILLISLLLFELYYILPFFWSDFLPSELSSFSWLKVFSFKDNIEIIGLVLYSHFLLFFIYVSVILLLAMVGSIFLTLNQNLQVKRQSVFHQREKKLYDSIKFYT